MSTYPLVHSTAFYLSQPPAASTHYRTDCPCGKNTRFAVNSGLLVLYPSALVFLVLGLTSLVRLGNHPPKEGSHKLKEYLESTQLLLAAASSAAKARLQRQLHKLATSLLQNGRARIWKEWLQWIWLKNWGTLVCCFNGEWLHERRDSKTWSEHIRTRT